MKIGIIGCGNMATAIFSGLVKNNYSNKDILVSDHSEFNLLKASNMGINTTLNNQEVAEFSDYLILAVKPQYLPEVCLEIKNYIAKETVVISIAAGYSMEKLGNDLSFAKIIRVMPNTAALVGESMSAICLSESISEVEKNSVLQIFEVMGEVEIVDESLMPAVIAVSGSSPAYGYIMLEAMGDAACELGMSRKQAYKFAAQALKGVGEMYLQTETHPAILKDNVCSPKGTTIEAVRILEAKGFRTAIIEAMLACGIKSEKM